MSRAAAIRLLTAALIAAYSLAPSSAAAGGLEYSAAGATALGRGGAVAARADDPMVLSYNPAGLVELRGSQALLDFNIALMSACVDPIGYYGWGDYGGGHPIQFTDPRTHVASPVLNLGKSPTGPAEKAYYNDPLDTVCMNQHVVPVPQLIITSRISEKFGIGGGLVFPAISPTGSWGGPTGLIRGDTGELRPAATRYMLMNTGNLGVFPTFGAAYRITKWLRVGAAFEWGMVWVDTTTMGGISTGTGPDNDVIAHIRARDMFVPGANASVHLVPTDSLDIVAAFRYEDGIHAPGKLDLTTGAFGAETVARTTHDLNVLSVNQNMPWKLRAGVRYSDRLAPRPNGTGHGEGGQFASQPIHDAMQDERWDAELDVEYQINSRNQQQVINYSPNQLVEFQGKPGVSLAGGNGVTTAAFPDPTAPNTVIQKHWKDQVVVRAGGTYNVLPGLFSVSAGASYETRGIDPNYMQIDFWPVQRIGLHGGVSFRILGQTDLVFSYAHIFQETITVAAPPQENVNDISAAGGIPKTIDRTTGTASSRDPNAPDAPKPLYEKNAPASPDGVARLTQVTTKIPAGHPLWIVNSGTYRSSMDVIAIGVHGHF